MVASEVDFTPYIVGLSSQDMQIRAEAVRHLIEVGEPAVETLIKLLETGDSLQQQMAAQVLGRIGDQRASAALMTALDDSDPLLQIAAAEALGELREVKAAPLLVKIMCRTLRESVGLHRLPIQMAEALKNIGEAAVEPLIEALRDEHEEVKIVAARALQEIGQPALNALIAALRDDDIEVRRRVVWLLWTLGDRTAVEPLIAALKDPDAKMRRYAAWALGVIGDVRAIDPLIRTLTDEDERVRWDITVALEKIGETALGSLVTALHDANPMVRIGAAGALGWIMNERTVEPLAHVLLWDENPQVRTKAAFALGWIRSKRSVSDLCEALRDDDEQVKMQAASALGWIRDRRAVEPLYQALLDNGATWVISAVVEALGVIGDEQAIHCLRMALRSPNSFVAQAAQRMLQTIGKTRLS
jgi:HEAT repeat protein